MRLRDAIFYERGGGVFGVKYGESLNVYQVCWFVIIVLGWEVGGNEALLLVIIVLSLKY